MREREDIPLGLDLTREDVQEWDALRERERVHMEAIEEWWSRLASEAAAEYYRKTAVSND